MNTPSIAHHVPEKTRSLWSVALSTLALAASSLGAGSSANYSFTTTTTGSLASDLNSNTVDMTTGTTQLIAASQDDVASSVTSIGFDFYLMGHSLYTQFAVTSQWFGVTRRHGCERLDLCCVGRNDHHSYHLRFCS
jgi:hypothetical protein